MEINITHTHTNTVCQMYNLNSATAKKLVWRKINWNCQDENMRRDRYKPDGFSEWVILLPPVIMAIFVDIDVDMGWFDGDAELCVNPITFTPFTCPLFLAELKLSFSTDGWFWVPGCAPPLPLCWCLSAFVRRLFDVIVGSRFRRTCSTGSTRRRFFGSFDRAYDERK